MSDPASPPAFAAHDHADCMRATLGGVDADCRARGLRLTAVRRRVLEILLESHRAMGAYDILARLAEEGRPAQPPVVYRALEFLQTLGVVHRLHRLNAFIACAHAHDGAPPAFLICRACRRVGETAPPELQGALEGAATGAGFVLERATVEAVGLCPACAGTT